MKCKFIVAFMLIFTQNTSFGQHNCNIQKPDSVIFSDTLCFNFPTQFSLAIVPHGYFPLLIIKGGEPNFSNSSSPIITFFQKHEEHSINILYISKVDTFCKSDTLIIKPNFYSQSPEPIHGPDTVCSNSFQVYESFAPGFDYDWSIHPPIAGSISSGQGSSLAGVQWNNYSGIAQVRILRKLCNWIIIDTMNVFVDSLPPPTIIGPDSVCQLDPANFYTTPTYDTYNWHFANGNYRTDASPTYAFPDSGSFVISVEAFINGCQNSTKAFKTIYIKPAPIGFISSNDPLFRCNRPELIATMQGFGSLSVEWFRSSGSFSTANPVTTNQSGIHYAIITDSYNGCSRKTNDLIVKECPNGNAGTCDIDPNDTIVFNYTITNNCNEISFTPSITNGRILEAVIGANVYTTFPAVHDFDKAGYFTVYVSARVLELGGSPGDSCFLDSTYSIHIPLHANFYYHMECTAGDSVLVHLVNTSTYTPNEPITSTDWYLNAAGTPFSTGFHATILLPAGTNHAIDLIVGNGAQSCTASVNINVPAAPIADFILPGPNCVQQAVTFIDNSSGSIVKRFWDYGDGATAIINQSTFRVFGSPLTNHNITLIVTDDYGCMDTVVKQIDVFENEISTTISPNLPIIKCAKESQLIEHINNPFTPLTLTYVWNNAATTSSITVDASGEYFVTVTEPSTSCLQRLGPAIVLFAPAINPIIDGDTSFCEGQLVVLNGYRGDNYTYVWKDMSNNTIGTNPILNWTAPPSALYEIKLILTDANTMCKDTAIANINVHPLPSVNITSMPSPACSGSLITLESNVSSPDVVRWSTGENTYDIDVYQNGQYYAEATSPVGCIGSDLFYVTLTPELDLYQCGCYSFCYDFSRKLAGVPGYYDSWEWIVDGNTHSTGFGNVPSISPLLGLHTYSLYLDINGCISESCETEINTYLCNPCIDVACEPCDSSSFIFEIDSCGSDSAGWYVYKLLANVYYSGTGNGHLVYMFANSGFLLSNPIPISFANGTNTFFPFYFTYDPAGSGYFCFTLIIQDSITLEYCILDYCFEFEGCEDRSMNINPASTSFENKQEQQDLKIFPNPAGESVQINLSGKASIAEVCLENAMGICTKQVRLTDSVMQYQLSLHNTPPGFYIIKITDTTGKRYTAKLIVK
jgi:hypothetical protein